MHLGVCVCVCVHVCVLPTPLYKDGDQRDSLWELFLSFLWANRGHAPVVRPWQAAFHLYLLSGPISPSFLLLKTRSHAPQTGLRLDK